MTNASKASPISYGVIFMYPLLLLTAEILGNPLHTNITYSRGHSLHFHKNLNEEIENSRSTNEGSPHFPNGDFNQTFIIQPAVTKEQFPLDTSDYKDPIRNSSSMVFSELISDTYASQVEDTAKIAEPFLSEPYLAYEYTDDSPDPYHKLNDNEEPGSVPIEAIFPSDVTYEELVSLNASCNEMHHCKQNRLRDVLGAYGCNCDRSCIELDTCCVDSPFRKTKPSTSGPNIKCEKVYGEEAIDIFMVVSCKMDWPSDDENTPELCSSNGEDTSDPFLFVPVTSLKTGLTYKNYYCAVCNGDSLETDLAFWDVLLRGNLDVFSGPEIPQLTFESTSNTWMATDNETDNSSTAVIVNLHIPTTAQSLVKMCTANIISKCSDSWAETSIASKCSAYMASIFISASNETKLYRNPHCAICNYESLSYTKCSVNTEFAYRVYDAIFAGLFVLEDRRRACKENMVYDRLAKKCRVLGCSKKKKQVVRAGKCVDKDTR